LGWGTSWFGTGYLLEGGFIGTPPILGRMSDLSTTALAAEVGCHPHTVRRFIARLRREEGPGSGNYIDVSETEARQFRVYTRVHGLTRSPGGWDAREGVTEAAFAALEGDPEGRAEWCLALGRAGADGAELYASAEAAVAASERYLGQGGQSCVFLRLTG